MRAPFALISLLCAGLGGCEQLKDVQDKVAGWTNPLVMQGLYLGVAEPDIDGFDLSKTDFDDGTSALLFLADASNVDDLENAPVSGAGVALKSDGNGRVSLGDEGDGAYRASASDGLTYTAGEQISLIVNMGDSQATGAVQSPAAADLDVPEQHDKGEALSLNLTGQSFDSLLVVVFDATSGKLTFSNQPETVKEIYDFTHGGGDEALIVDVPGSAFPSEGLYAVGAAGLRAASADDFEDANTALSSLLSGKLKFYPVSTLSL